MPIPESLNIKNGMAHFRPRGEHSLVEAVDLINSAITYCRVRRAGKLLVDGTGVTGVPIPSLVDRFLMVEEWAQRGEGVVAVALVVDTEYIHPEKFGVQVAAHFGLILDVFTSQEDALKWLLAVS